MTDGTVQTAWPVNAIDTDAPWSWLQRGWQDFRHSWLLSALHGVALLSVGCVIVLIGYHSAPLLAGAFSGFMLLAPGVLAGVYALSRSLSQGVAVDWGTGLRAWQESGWRTVRFGLVLAAIGTCWVAISSIIVHAASGAGQEPDAGLLGYLRFFAADEQSLLFYAWLLSGALLAALVFCGSVVSMPLLIDRPVSVRSAILTSFAAVSSNPVAMALWAVLIMLLSLVALISVIGLVVLLPVLGHATWHAYRDLVSQLPDT